MCNFEENRIAVSGIVPRLEDLNFKSTKVNSRLELMCKQFKVYHLYLTVKPFNPISIWAKVIFISIILVSENLQKIIQISL